MGDSLEILILIISFFSRGPTLIQPTDDDYIDLEKGIER